MLLKYFTPISCQYYETLVAEVVEFSLLFWVYKCLANCSNNGKYSLLAFSI